MNLLALPQDLFGGYKNEYFLPKAKYSLVISTVVNYTEIVLICADFQAGNFQKTLAARI